MKNNLNLQLVLTALFCSYFLITKGQNMTVKSVALQPNDQTAIQYPCLDNNGDTCALLKIKTDRLEGIEFSNPNQYIKVDYRDGIYSVYVPTVTRKLDFQHKDYMPLQLDMAEYGYKKLRKGRTYLVILDAPKKTELKSTFVLKVVPVSSKVVFDKQEVAQSENGTYELPISEGTHEYQVEAQNYSTKSGNFSIGKSEVKTLAVQLTPILHEVNVGCNIDNARVYVDNVDYGGIGKRFLPQGNHTIRLQADGYEDSEQTVEISSDTKFLSFILKENKRITHIHATPVRIISSSSCIYKNNKKIKNWYSGATIMFMPGKYKLSDDNGHTKKITVGSEPMVVRLFDKQEVVQSENGTYELPKSERTHKYQVEAQNYSPKSGNFSIRKSPDFDVASPTSLARSRALARSHARSRARTR